MKKALKIFLGLIISFILVLTIVVNVSLPKLPEGTRQVIKEVRHGELRELAGETGFAYNGSTKIWYETILPEDRVNGTMLLIMGISADALAWPMYFVDSLVAEGYRVVRFDNRGTGLTDWFEDWNKNNAYSLEDMASDGIAVLDHLEIEKAHVIGVSLGGMIAQTMTIEFPERTSTMTSIMSTGYMMDPELPSFNTSIIKELIFTQIKYGMIPGESARIKLSVAVRQLLEGDIKTDLDIEDIAQSTLYNERRRNGLNSKSVKQQSEAVILSGSRYESLNSLEIPALIIHGTTDPMISFEHGKKCYEQIPGASKLWIEGMGHDIPPMFAEEVIDKIIELIEAAP